jgi:hypothetical protein
MLLIGTAMQEMRDTLNRSEKQLVEQVSRMTSDHVNSLSRHKALLQKIPRAMYDTHAAASSATKSEFAFNGNDNTTANEQETHARVRRNAKY